MSITSLLEIKFEEKCHGLFHAFARPKPPRESHDELQAQHFFPDTREAEKELHKRRNWPTGTYSQRCSR